MTSQSASGSVPSSSVPSNMNEWNDVLPKKIDCEDSLSAAQSKKVWEKMYGLAGLGSAGEKERKSLRAAVYVYTCVNGCSREGDYSGTMILSSGTQVSAAVIPRAAGKMQIRKFMRANMDEAYDFFKQSGVMQSDDRFIAKAAKLGVSAENAFALADYLTDCWKFTPGESKAHDAKFAVSIERARRARGGHSLEEVEAGRRHHAIEVNGPEAVQSESIDF